MATLSSVGMKNNALLALMLERSKNSDLQKSELVMSGGKTPLQFNFSQMDLSAVRSQMLQQENAAQLYTASQSVTLLSVASPGETSRVEVQENGTITLEGAEVEADSQLAKNLSQAQQVIKQLGLKSEAWGVESLARDLALFDMDLTVLKDNPHDVAALIRAKSQELVEAMDAEASKTGVQDLDRRRAITGAASRLSSGLAGAASAVARASVSVNGSSKQTVVIDGKVIDATAIISAGNVVVDPLVFDLNGDGLNLRGAEDGVDFDMNGDGEQTRMGFIQGDDALLFLDTHGDGLVHDGTQLFGNQGGYANGFDMLRQYDENGDGIIDENDEIFDKLRLWVEKDPNGICEEGETISLREAGITSINLNYDNVRLDDGSGNIVGQTGSFTRSDGSAGYAADVWFHELAQRPEGY